MYCPSVTFAFVLRSCAFGPKCVPAHYCPHAVRPPRTKAYCPEYHASTSTMARARWGTRLGYPAGVPGWSTMAKVPERSAAQLSSAIDVI